jgi:hypothetical protein
MASREAAIKNNLNDRARKVGQFDELTTQDIDALIAFYDFTCLYPGCNVKPATSVDHVKPLSKGGTNTYDNLQLLCVNHNKAKGDEEIDYREGKVFTGENIQGTRKNKRHNWYVIKQDYITSQSSLRELAEKYGTELVAIGERSSAENWVEEREQFCNRITTETTNALAKEQVATRVWAALVTEQAARRFLADNPPVKLHELVAALRLRGEYEGELSSGTQTNILIYLPDNGRTETTIEGTRVIPVVSG